MKYFFHLTILLFISSSLIGQIADANQVFDSTHQVLEKKTLTEYSKHTYEQSIRYKKEQIFLIERQRDGIQIDSLYLDSLSIINNQDLAALRYLSGYIQGEDGKDYLKRAESATIEALKLSKNEFERCKLIHNKSMIQRELGYFKSAKEGFDSVIVTLDSLISNSSNDSLIILYLEIKINTLNEVGELYLKEYLDGSKKSKLYLAKEILQESLNLADSLIKKRIEETQDTLYPYFMKEIYHRLIKVYKYENKASNADSIKGLKEVLLTNNYQELPNTTLRDKIRLDLMELMLFDGIREVVLFKEENSKLFNNLIITIVIVIFLLIILVISYSHVLSRNQLLNTKNTELEILKKAFNQSHTGIVIINEKGIIQYRNKQSDIWHQLEVGSDYLSSIIKKAPGIQSRIKNSLTEAIEKDKAQFSYNFNINKTERLRLKVDFTKVESKDEILYYITETDISKTYLLLNNLQDLTETLIQQDYVKEHGNLINSDNSQQEETSKTNELLIQFIKNTIPQLSKTLKVSSFFAGKINFDYTRMDVPVSFEVELPNQYMESQVHKIKKDTNLLSYCYYENELIYEDNFSKNYKNYVSKEAYETYLNDCLEKEISPAESVIYIPLALIEGKAPIGILSVQSKDKNSYTEEDFEFVKSLGRNLALALWNAQLQDEKELVLNIIGHRFRNRFSTFKKHREELYNNYNNWAYNSISEAREDIIKIMLEDEELKQTFDNLIIFNSRLNPKISTIGEFTIHEEINKTIKEVELSASLRNVDILFNSELTIRDKALMEIMHFNEILTNLLVNALAAYDTLNDPQRARSIIIKVEKQIKEKRFKISIADNAGGMTEQTQRLLFKSNLKKDRTGLGSLICKKLIEHYNESIKIETSTPNGTTISFTIPKS